MATDTHVQREDIVKTHREETVMLRGTSTLRKAKDCCQIMETRGSKKEFSRAVRDMTLLTP